MLKPVGEQHKKNPVGTRYKTNIQKFYISLKIIVNYTIFFSNYETFIFGYKLIFLVRLQQ